ncbi:MAG: RNA methyltransferase [Verrucomicrobia bacterium]|nr:RNA methyltransferase [Verrucomicrobiota bacterium]
MFRVQTIDTLDHPELLPYRTMRQQSDHHRQGIFVAEGEKVVRRLLASPLTVISALFPPQWLESFEPLLQSRPEEIQVFLAEKKILENLTGFSMYQGVLALGRIPGPVSLTEILERAKRPYLFAAVDGLSSAENLGGLVRNCVAFGVHALLAGETSASPYLRRAVRSSMGTIFQLPVVQVVCLAEAIQNLRSKAVHCVAAHPHADRRTLSEADLGGDCCIAFGSEGHGISRRVLGACNEAAAIPMAPGVDSLNVGSASAVVLYEASRQREAANKDRG